MPYATSMVAILAGVVEKVDAETSGIDSSGAGQSDAGCAWVFLPKQSRQS